MTESKFKYIVSGDRPILKCIALKEAESWKDIMLKDGFKNVKIKEIK